MIKFTTGDFIVVNINNTCSSKLNMIKHASMRILSVNIKDITLQCLILLIILIMLWIKIIIENDS